MDITIDEASRILTLDIESGCSTPPADLDKAERLGIEALKREKYNREHFLFPASGPLPGEQHART